MPTVRRVAPAGGTGLLLLLVVLLLGLAASFPPGAAARTTCSYAGAPRNVLTVTVKDDAVGEIRRRGLGIAVRGQDEPLSLCAGGAPTVLNTDTIKVVLVELSFVDIDLSGGPFAPGATLETEGASEIEIQISSGLGVADIIGTPGDDEWHWGPGGANPGLNVNPREAGDQDVDITVTSDENEAGPLFASGAGGNDTIIGAPGATVHGIVVAEGGYGDDVLSAPRFDTSSDELGSADLDGGVGDDVITGGALDDELDGGVGSDRVAGRGGADKISGGRGRDRLSGGAGPDVINSRDFSSDVVSCGSGRDRVNRDARDEFSGCERSGAR